MEWNHLNTNTLARPTCAYCLGTGSCKGRGGKDEVCDCKLRESFKECFDCFRVSDLMTTRVEMDHMTQMRKAEDFRADFCLISRRTLDASEWRLFSAYYLLGADARLCARQFKMSLDTFKHARYRVELKLGRAFRETEPFPLYPVRQYFDSAIRGAVVLPCVVPNPRPRPHRLARAA